MNLRMKLEAHAGSEIAATALHMQMISDRLDVTVEVQFNDVTLFAVPGGRARWLADNFHAEATRKDMLMRPRWAWSHKQPEVEASGVEGEELPEP